MFCNENVDSDNAMDYDSNNVTAVSENSQSVNAILERRIHLNVLLDILLNI